MTSVARQRLPVTLYTCATYARLQNEIAPKILNVNTQRRIKSDTKHLNILKHKEASYWPPELVTPSTVGGPICDREYDGRRHLALVAPSNI